MALVDCAEAAVYVSHMLREVCNFEFHPKIVCYVDNKSLVETLSSGRLTDDRYLRINITVLHDLMNQENVLV